MTNKSKDHRFPVYRQIVSRYFLDLRILSMFRFRDCQVIVQWIHEQVPLPSSSTWRLKQLNSFSTPLEIRNNSLCPIWTERCRYMVILARASSEKWRVCWESMELFFRRARAFRGWISWNSLPLKGQFLFAMKFKPFLNRLTHLERPFEKINLNSPLG